MKVTSATKVSFLMQITCPLFVCLVSYLAHLMQLITIEVLAFQVFVQKFWMVSIELRNATNFTLGFKPVTVVAIEYVDI